MKSRPFRVGQVAISQRDEQQVKKVDKSKWSKVSVSQWETVTVIRQLATDNVTHCETFFRPLLDTVGHLHNRVHPFFWLVFGVVGSVMMLSLAPLKLLNVAQLALISRLLLNRNSAIDVPSSEGAVNRLGGKTGKPPTTPGTGNVLIFLGKHTIQLSPEQIATSPSSNRSRYVARRPFDESRLPRLVKLPIKPK